MISSMLIFMSCLGQPAMEQTVYTSQLMDTPVAVVCDYPEWNPNAPEPERPHLTRSGGTFAGPSGKETWYNLPMGYCIEEIRKLGYSVEEYPFHIREDGAKCIGDLVLCASNNNYRPKGTIVETSLGMAIVVDSCEAANSDPTLLDLCVDWR